MTNQAGRSIRSLHRKHLNSENFARVLDLFGGNVYFLDVDSFSEGDAAQNDLIDPNRLVSKNDIFKYHYDLDANEAGGFLQLISAPGRSMVICAGEASDINYQRNGHFQNGNFPENSLGKSRQLNFGNYGLKAGLTYKISGRHLLNFNTAYFTKPPSLRNSFSNASQNNDAVRNLNNEKIFTGDASYIIQMLLF